MLFRRLVLARFRRLICAALRYVAAAAAACHVQAGKHLGIALALAGVGVQRLPTGTAWNE